MDHQIESRLFNEFYYLGVPVRIDSFETVSNIHSKLEIKLLTHQIVGTRPLYGYIALMRWDLRRKHIKHFLDDYLCQYQVLPTGLHDLGNSRYMNAKVGVINFGQVRKLLLQDLRIKDSISLQNWQESNEISMFSLHREISEGFRLQSSGENLNEVLPLRRKQLSKREWLLTSWE